MIDTIARTTQDVQVIEPAAEPVPLRPGHGIWIASVDNETTNLDRRSRMPWEIGIVLRNPTGGEREFRWMASDVDLKDPGVNLESLKIGGFDERHPKGVYFTGQLPDDVAYCTWEEIARSIVLDCFSLVPRGERIYWLGAVPDFDEADVYHLLDMHGLIDWDGAPRWHYHLIDVETLAAGALRIPPPWDFDAMLAEFGLTFPAGWRHTALGDARMNLRLLDAVLTR